MTRDEAKELIAEADKSFNSATIAHVLLKLVKYGFTLADCERMLRDLESQTYLVAWNWTVMPKGFRPTNIYGNKCDDAVWICLHGADERDAELLNFGLANQDANLKALKTAGFSTMATN